MGRPVSYFTMLGIQRGNLGLLIVGTLFLVVLASVWAEAEHHPAEAGQAGLTSLNQRAVREADLLNWKRENAAETNKRGNKRPPKKEGKNYKARNKKGNKRAVRKKGRNYKARNKKGNKRAVRKEGRNYKAR